MSVKLIYRSILTVIETLTAQVPDVAPAAAQITHDQFNTSFDLTANTTPKVQVVSSQVLALVAGAATLDLTNLPGTNGATVNGTGMKVRALKFKGITGKGVFTIKQGAANAYSLNGAIAWQVPVGPDQEVTILGGDSCPVVSGTVKNIDFAGTLTDTIQAEIILG